MPPFTLWRGPGARGKDFQFFDRIASNFINMSGTEFYVHKYLGPANKSQSPTGASNVLSIEDLVNLEVRDRQYDTNVYSLIGHHLVTDSEFDLKQFGLFLSSDTLFVTFHTNDMFNALGRRLMSGDVLEVLHMRDPYTLDGVPINKFYLIEEGISPSEGYSPSWWPHLWRVKCQPLPDSQEYQQILNQVIGDRGDGVQQPANADGTPATVGSATSTYNTELAINDAILAEAQANVAFRNFQAQHFWIDDTTEKPSVFNSDGIPPNGSKPVPSGTTFPQDVKEGDWFLRLDYIPPVLFHRENKVWARYEANWRTDWLPAGALLTSFINNNNTTQLDNGTTTTEKQNIRTVIKPKIDPDIV